MGERKSERERVREREKERERKREESILSLVLFSYESWYTAQSFCEERDARLPVLNHRKDLQLFEANSSTFTFYLGLRKQVRNIIHGKKKGTL